MTIDPQLRELQLVFIEEAKQLLDDAEETLLKLEINGFDTNLVNTAFRYAHNFKGSSSSVGFTELGSLAHKYEDILSAIKKGTKNISKPLISALLKCNDVLRQEVLALQADLDHVVSIKQAMAELLASSEGEAAAPQAPNTTVEAAASAKENLSAGFGFFEDTPSPAPSAPSPAIKKEPAPSKAQKPVAVDEMLKIPAKRLDMLLNIIGELVINQSILDDCRSRDETGSPLAVQAIGYTSKLIFDIQNISLSLRLVPIKPLFQKLRRTARDVADALKKEVNLIDEGDDCELDKGVIDRISDPLNHMIRNSMDHGVDTADERATLGKSTVATVFFSVIPQEDRVLIVIEDDGRGLNTERIRAKAIANGLITADQNLSEQDTFRLIFQPGFSTKEQVTGVSGRGVGMEVVERAINDLKGTIRIESKLGRGTRFEIALPLSLSIIDGMVVQANGQRFVVPVSQLIETIELSKFSMETVTGIGKTLNLRGEVLPVYNLSEILSRKCNRPVAAQALSSNSGQLTRPALVTHFKGKKVSFEVDSIINQQRIVLKHLGKEFDGLPGIIAGAILSNGEPSLVLSLEKLVAGAE